MRYIFSTIVASILLVGCNSSGKLANDLAINTPILTAIDLTQVVDDKAPVIINPGRITTDTVTYYLPKVVQGTYAVSDFGKYIDGFKAVDYDGNEMEVTKGSTNSWTISNATKLDIITYLVNDTFDVEGVETVKAALVHRAARKRHVRVGKVDHRRATSGRSLRFVGLGLFVRRRAWCLGRNRNTRWRIG